MKEDLLNCEPYPDEVKALLTIEGYNRQFEQLTQRTKTLHEAWELTEDLHYHYFGIEKYREYKNFAFARRKLITRK